MSRFESVQVPSALPASAPAHLSASTSVACSFACTFAACAAMCLLVLEIGCVVAAEHWCSLSGHQSVVDRKESCTSPALAYRLTSTFIVRLVRHRASSVRSCVRRSLASMSVCRVRGSLGSPWLRQLGRVVADWLASAAAATSRPCVSCLDRSRREAGPFRLPG